MRREGVSSTTREKTRPSSVGSLLFVPRKAVGPAKTKGPAHPSVPLSKSMRLSDGLGNLMREKKKTVNLGELSGKGLVAAAGRASDIRYDKKLGVHSPLALGCREPTPL